MTPRAPLPYICVRAQDGERPPTRTATVGTCDRCGHRVWQTRLGLRAFRGPALCLECDAAEVRAW